MRRLPALLSVLILFLIAAAAHTLQESKPRAKDEKSKTRDVDAVGENYLYDRSKHLMTWGPGTIQEKDTVFTASHFEVTTNEDDEAQTGKATGGLKIENPEHELTGDLITIDFNKKLATISGNVKMVVKPKEPRPGQEDRSARGRLKDRAVLTCDKIDYYYRQKRAEAYGNLKVVQQVKDKKTGEEYERVITGEKGVYTEKDEQVVVTGNPVHYRDGKGNEVITGDPVTSSVKEGEEWLKTKKFQGKFKVKEEEEEGAAPPPQGPSNSPQKPSPPSEQKPSQPPQEKA